MTKAKFFPCWCRLGAWKILLNFGICCTSSKKNLNKYVLMHKLMHKAFSALTLLVRRRGMSIAVIKSNIFMVCEQFHIWSRPQHFHFDLCKICVGKMHPPESILN